MLTQCRLKLQITTRAVVRAHASSHTGGWSEGFWYNGVLASGDNKIKALAEARAMLLPGEGTCTGFRLGSYEILRNKLIPKGSATGKFNLPGVAGNVTDIPQMALALSCVAPNVPNASKIKLAGIPDNIAFAGEYQPTPEFLDYFNVFRERVVSDGWGFIGRDMTIGSARVLSLNANLLTTDGLLGAIVGDYVRFNRVFDSFGRPVSGAFRITAIHPANEYTLAGAGQFTVSEASGTVRRDELAFYDISGIHTGRIGTRKIGRPSEAYRGRASKR